MRDLEPEPRRLFADERGEPRLTIGGAERPLGGGRAEAPPRIGAYGWLEPLRPLPPQAKLPLRQGTEMVEERIEPPYGRRSVMQMEFPCGLNETASASFWIIRRPRPVS
jgi:hypothetical protein